jgi:uncharacterized membrane protein YhaH (DUF805 family)
MNDQQSPLLVVLIVMGVAWLLAKAAIYIRALHDEDEDP